MNSSDFFFMPITTISSVNSLDSADSFGIESFPSASLLSIDEASGVAALILWLICIEQKRGPHMEQKWAVLAGAAGKVSSWYERARSGSSDRAN